MAATRRALPVVWVLLAISGTAVARTQSVGAQKYVPTSGTLPPELQALDLVVHSILRQTGAPGAAMAVARDGRLVFARGYGYADRASGDHVQPTALFRIASVSKPVTAAAVLRLVDEGRLSLDDRMLDLIARPPVGTSFDPRIRDVTVGDLLYHAGGWDRQQSGFDPMLAPGRISAAMRERPPISVETIIRYMLERRLDFYPGTRQAYSNFGYAVLGRIIEAATGERYEDYVRRAVLEPSGAVRMRLARSLLRHRAEAEVRYHDDRRVRTVFPGTEDTVPVPYGGFSIEAMDAHGGWLASAPDLLRFLTAIDLNPTRPDLLKAETVQAMTSPHETANPDSEYYAMGWVVDRGKDGPAWYHRGDLPGTTALLACAGRTQFALLLNGNAGSREDAERMLPALRRAAESITTWPDRDLFPGL